MSRTINLVPTWEVAASIHLACIENGDDAAAQQASREAILDTARRIDWFNQHAPDDLKRKMLEDFS